MKNLPWDEMVFKNRNRSYGAYVIRKEYPSALIASFVFMLVVMALLFATTPTAFRLFKRIATGDKASKKYIYTIELPKDMANQGPKKSEVPLKEKR